MLFIMEKNMTEAEKRRAQLLYQMRELYRDKTIPPAVHPRYQSCYETLYESKADKTVTHSTLGLRIFIAVLLFAMFVAMDYRGAEYAAVDSKKIIQEIERQVDID